MTQMQMALPSTRMLAYLYYEPRMGPIGNPEEPLEVAFDTLVRGRRFERRADSCAFVLL